VLDARAGKVENCTGSLLLTISVPPVSGHGQDPERSGQIGRATRGGAEQKIRERH
jgi:hypothetical protein